MNRIILITFLFMGFLIQLTAQNKVTLKINHKLGSADFAMNAAAKNNMDHDFKVTRLEYYISGISLVHDGGTQTSIDDVWILANAATRTEVELGEYDINTIEKVKFHIGVGSRDNHLDPASFPAGHPLAPKAPSMHWGWAAGYRFVAIEGNGSSAYNRLFQLHGLDDKNYFETEIAVDLTAENNLLAINLDADYARALEDISVNSGVIVHGDNREAKQCLENFRDYVFSPASGNSSTTDFNAVQAFRVFPNPVVNGTASIKWNTNNEGTAYNLSVSSLTGKQLMYVNAVNSGEQLDVSEFVPGIYFIQLMDENETVVTDKFIIK